MLLQKLMASFRARFKRFHLDASLRQDFAWILSGNVIYYASQWSYLIILAKLGTPEEVGEYALGVAICTPVMIFANLQLRALFASDVKNRYSFEQYLGFRWVSLTIALLVIAGFMIGHPAHVAATILLVGVMQGLEYYSELYFGLMQKHDRMDRISRSLTIKGPASVAALAVTMYVTRDLIWALTAVIAVRVVVILLYDTRLSFRARNGQVPTESNRPELRLDMTWVLFTTSLSLGIISSLLALNLNIPAYFIEAHLGKSALGIFSAMASLIGSGNLVMNAMSQSAFLPLARAYADRDKGRWSSIMWHLWLVSGLLGAAGVLGAAFMGQTVLTHIFRPEYARSVDVFVRLMLAGGLAYIATSQGSVLTAIGTRNAQIPVQAVGMAATALACYLLIPAYGAAGAADAMVIAGMVRVIGFAILLSRVTRFENAVPEQQWNTIGS